MQKITPCLWFDSQAEEAAEFYVSLFKNSKISTTACYGEEGAKVSGRPQGTVMTVTFTLNGQEFMGLNGGPIFKFTPAISLFVYCKTTQDVDELFKKLSHKGEILMPLDKYSFSEKYAFIKDKFGVSWQLMLSPAQHHIAPCFLFVNKNLGKAENALRFYTSLFKHARIEQLSYYGKGEPGKVGTVKYSSFLLEGQEFIAMDGAGTHAFTFNESISFMVHCDTQKELDYYWDKLSEDGDKNAQQCGWLKDKYGVSWQIVPTVLDDMMKSKKSEKIMNALLQMKKIDIAKLEQALK